MTNPVDPTSVNPLYTTSDTPNDNLGQDLTDVHSLLFGEGVDPTATGVQVTPSSVGGTQGIPDISTTVQNTWDSLANALAAVMDLEFVDDSDNSLPQLSGAVQQLAQVAVAALTQATAAANALSTMANTSPLWWGMNSAFVQTTVPIGMVAGTSTATTLSSAASGGHVTGNSPITYVAFPQAATLTGVVFPAALPSSQAPSGVYLNLYTLNKSNGTLTNIGTSPNLISGIPTYSSSISSMAWVTWTFTEPIDVNAGDILAIDICMATSQTSALVFMYLFGLGNNMPKLTGIYPPSFASYRPYDLGSSSSISPASVTASQYTSPGAIMFFGFLGSTATTFINQVPTMYLADATYTVPTWATKLGVIGWGGGGGGGGGTFGGGGTGSSTTVANGSNTLTAPGGTGGSNGIATDDESYGLGAESVTYEGVHASGGTAVGPTFPGSAPGGGGGGAKLHGNYGYGGNPATPVTATWDVVGGSTVTITIGAGGVAAGIGGAAAGGKGGVWLVAIP